MMIDWLSIETPARESREARKTRKELNTMRSKEWINKLKVEFVGRKVLYEGKVYTIADVDYNGLIHINKASQFNNTTAVYEPHEARKALIVEN